MIEMRKLPTGEIIAFDTEQNRQVASGFSDEDDFQEWFNATYRQNDREDWPH